MREQLSELKRDAAKAKAKPKAKPSSEAGQATQKIIARIEKRMSEWVNRPACASLAEIAFVEVTIAPDAEPGPREIRLVTAARRDQPAGVPRRPSARSRPEADEDLRLPGARQGALAQRKRPPEEVEETHHRALHR